MFVCLRQYVKIKFLTKQISFSPHSHGAMADTFLLFIQTVNQAQKLFDSKLNMKYQILMLDLV